MAFIGQYVDPNAQPATDFSPVPSGEYVAQIIDSDLKPTRTNDGQYLELTYRIVEGPMTGRQVWARLNLDNLNADTVRIANEHLASIRAACGLRESPDSAMLHNIPHIIRVEFIPAGTTDRRGRVQQKDGNEVRGWKRIDGAATAAAGLPPAPATRGVVGNAAPAAPAGKPSWAQPRPAGDAAA
ncbi:hypothetical protein FHW12_000307 [Dokdonella fugitiva]|uniref:DUF669 domain-containing protein n=1 Tax=Dokdonella fugitiva TaxID=328517 RepID=A0A839EUM4_9GAMM|nr:DUF669 domain-containing protein [Dokdonella fugitiva]MBA8886116.1 hypothetical protein [Dokdonella fugitiva]